MHEPAKGRLIAAGPVQLAQKNFTKLVLITKIPKLFDENCENKYGYVTKYVL